MKTLGCRWCLLYKHNSANVWLFWKHGITSDNIAILYWCCQLVLKYLDNSRLQPLIPPIFKRKIPSVQWNISKLKYCIKCYMDIIQCSEFVLFQNFTCQTNSKSTLNQVIYLTSGVYECDSIIINTSVYIIVCTSYKSNELKRCPWT